MSVYVGFKIGKARERKAYISECYCGACGWPVSDHDSYCPECGGAFRKEDATECTCEMPMVFEDDEGNELDSSAAYFRHYRCSNCGEIMEHYKYEHWSYCPNCGAKVIVDEG